MGLIAVRKQYDELAAQNPEMRRKHRALAELRWITTSYELDTDEQRNGLRPMTIEDVQLILDGEFLIDRNVEDHTNVRNYQKMIRHLYSLVEVKDKADMALIRDIHRILSDDRVMEYRQRIPIVRDFAFVPTHYQSIDEELEDVIRYYLQQYDKWSPVLRGCFLHNEFIKIFPYEEWNAAVGRALLNFELICAGYLPLAFDMEVAEYKNAVADHVKKNRPQTFFELIRKTLEEMYRDYLDYSI